MKRTFRAAVSSYVVLVGMLSIPAVLWVAVMLWNRRLELEALIVSLVLPLGVAVWLARFRLILSEDGFSYRSLLGGTKVVGFAEVDSVVASRTAPASGTPLGLRIRKLDGEEIEINVKPFPRAAAQVLLAAVRPNKPLQPIARENARSG